MTDSTDPLPPAAATFESVEAELKEATGRLEDPAVPLGERLELHARAVSLHGKLEAIVEAAQEATTEIGRDAAAEDPGPEANSGAPYEAVRDRLAEVVNTLEREDLPLARAIDLYREARRLAARCETILDAAQRQVAETTTRTIPRTAAGEGAEPEAATPLPAARTKTPESDAPV